MLDLFAKHCAFFVELFLYDGDAVVDLTLGAPVTEVLNKEIEFRNVDAVSIGTWGSVAGDPTLNKVVGTFTLQTFGPGDSITLYELNNFTVTTGDSEGDLVVQANMTGDLTVQNGDLGALILPSRFP